MAVRDAGTVDEADVRLSEGFRLAAPSRQKLSISAWFREALAGEASALAKSRTLGETGWFDMATIARIADEHRMGRGEHGRTLWQFVMLERSMKRMFG